MQQILNKEAVDIQAYIYHKTETLPESIKKAYRDSLCSILTTSKDVKLISDTETKQHQYMEFGCKWADGESTVDIPYLMCITRLNRYLPHMVKDKAVINAKMVSFNGQKIHYNYYGKEARREDYNEEEFPIIISNIGTFFTCLDGNHRLSAEVDRGAESTLVYYCVPSLTKRCIGSLYTTVLYMCVVDLGRYEAMLKRAEDKEAVTKEWYSIVMKENTEVFKLLQI